jgi:tRNA (cmo5U34)-methyltransferase
MTQIVESGRTSLGHMPAGPRWEFDQGVTDVFSDMLARSIPQYTVMRRAVFEIGASVVQPGTAIVDLGCARGDALAPFIARFGMSNQHVGVDVSGPMLTAARTRFAADIEAGYVRLLDTDLRTNYPHGQSSLTLCVLTLQFTPLEHRQQILQHVFANTVVGGAVILVEKVLGSTTRLGRMLIDHYHAYKTAQGYSAEEIERKRLALEGVLVPATAAWNEELLRAVGFEELDCFWRWMNFSGWVALKSR